MDEVVQECERVGGVGKRAAAAREVSGLGDIMFLIARQNRRQPVRVVLNISIKQGLSLISAFAQPIISCKLLQLQNGC